MIVARWRVRAVAGVVTALLAVLSPGATNLAPSAQASSTCVESWRPVGFPASLSAMQPMGIAALGSQPAWVVGLATARAETGRRPLIGVWRNGAWEKIRQPIRGYGILNAVATTAANNAWTVGSSGSYVRWPISARWNGTAWRAVDVSRPAGQGATLVDLAMIDKVRFWAVGARLQDGLLKPLAMLHRRGGWRFSDPVVAGGGEGGLMDVTIAPGGRTWAAGWRTDSDGQGRPWALYRSGDGWLTAPLGTIAEGRGVLTGLVFAAANDGWAAGFVETASHGYAPVLQHWNGTSWSSVSLPWAASRSVLLHAVAIDGSGRLIVAGMEVTQFRRDVLAALDGAGWTVTSLAADARRNAAIMDLAPLGTSAFAAGFHDAAPITLLPCTGAGVAATGTGLAGLRSAPGASSGESTFVADEHDEDAAALLEAVASRPAGLEVAATVAGTVAIDVTASAGLTMSSLTWPGLVADFDEDGWDDILINRHYRDPLRLMLNNGDGTFSELAADFAVLDRHGCATADVDLDGTLDLYCSIGANKGTTNTPKELLLNPLDGGGTWAGEEWGLLDGFSRGRVATFLNLDGDEFADLYVLAEPSRSDALWSSNRLYRNNDGAGFSSSPEWGLDHSLGANCVLATDLDHDGDDDILLCTSEPFGGLSRGARLYLNDGDRFVDRTLAWGITPDAVSDLELADFDGDGALDLAQLSATNLRVSLRRGDRFQLAYEWAIGGKDIALGDVNGDARADIYLLRWAKGNTGHMMLVNGGDGTTFTSMAIPQPGSGRPDGVLPIDYDHNGRTDFVTFNGPSGDGPTTLVAFFPEN